MKKQNKRPIIILAALSIVWCFICVGALIDYVKYKGQTAAELIAPLPERPNAPAVAHSPAHMQSVRSGVYAPASSEQNFTTHYRPSKSPSIAYRLYELSQQEVHHIGGGMGTPTAVNSGSAVAYGNAQEHTAAPTYTFASVVTPRRRTPEVHNIVAIAAEAEDAAIAQSAPARQAAAAKLPPPPVVNPNPENQLPIGDGWCMLLFAMLMAGVIYRRQQRETA